MRRAIGLDIGSTTAKVVVREADGGVLLRVTERHRGAPAEHARSLLAQARALAPEAPLGVTGSLGVALAERFGAAAVHEITAMTDAVRALVPGARSIVELGGQDAKIVWLGDDDADADAEMNDRCAAGTGATIDRIVRRLGIAPEALGAMALAGDARAAAKCGVFAETDVVNLVQRGLEPAHALAALARAIVVQNLAVLARGRVLGSPTVLLGGPHAHVPMLVEAWREALADLRRRRGLSPGTVLRPEHADAFAALGAALHAARGAPSDAVVRGALGAARIGPPIAPAPRQAASLALRPLPWRGGGRAWAPEAVPLAGGARAALHDGGAGVWVGLDAGSTSTKAVLLDAERGTMIASAYALSSGNPLTDARARLGEVLAQAPGRPALGLGVTGYGAEVVAAALCADVTVIETLAHARAAEAALPGVEVVVDVGGTDVKVLRLARGRPTTFHLSSQCAAGHGAFLATAAAELGVDLDGFADLALSALRSAEFGVGCAVFLDTDRVTFQREGHTSAEILAGLARALPRNVWEMVVGEPPRRLGRSFLLTGGVHRNLAVARAHADYLAERVPGARIAVHPTPELSGAIGAALEARACVGRSPSRFIGLARAERVELEVESGQATRCGRCEIDCARSFLRVRETDGDPTPHTLVLGNACERGGEAGEGAQRTRAHAVDLLAEEARRLFLPLLPDPPRRLARPPVVGIPRVMSLYRSAPLFLHYLRAAGVPSSHIVLSPTTSPGLFQDGARWAANDPCFPAKLVPAHVDWLLEHAAPKLDVLFLPTTTHAAIVVEGTRDTASCPIVAGCGHAAIAALRRDGDRLAARGVVALAPTLTLTDRARLEAQLLTAFGPLLGLDAEANAAALAHGLRAQAMHAARLRARGAWVLERARRAGRAAAVILARPYHADPGVQHGVSTALAARGIPVLGVASLPAGDRLARDLSSVLPDVTNSGCAERMWAARVIADDPHLVAVDLSSFRCGQDASTQGLLDDALEGDKPVLRLHDVDEHRPGISLALRIATFADAVARHERSLGRIARLGEAQP